jgi:uncharacterized protein (TIGR02266 family)
LKLEVEFGDETNFYTGFSENISTGGVFIATYNLVEIGKLIHLSLTLPDGETIEVHGRVQWVRDPRNRDVSNVPPGIGVQFQNLAPESEMYIQEFVSKQEPLFYVE